VEPVRLNRIRRNLTGWYVGTVAVILALLGIGLLATIRRQYSQELSRSLMADANQLRTAATSRARGLAALTNATGIPDRQVFITRPDGSRIDKQPVPAWLVAAARAAMRNGSVETNWEPSEDRDFRARAQRFIMPDGDTLVAVAVAEQAELEDRYSRVIVMFGAAAVVAILLATAGGWLLMRKSMKPVADSMDQMRRFMADAAHELRTPLTVIRSRAEVALQQPRDAAAYQESMRAIEEESGRMGAIVGDLLLLARADANERPVARERVYLDDIASDAAAAAHAMAVPRGVTVTVGDFDECVVIGDPVLLRQLMMILLDNAVKFTPSGGSVSVGITARGADAVLTVRDTGIGIPEAQQAHVFERFYRGDPSRARDVAAASAQGVGLGLSIASWIVSAHDATIELQSREGAGTTVMVRFVCHGGDR
jgi:signal transduction histidine kinase